MQKPTKLRVGDRVKISGFVMMQGLEDGNTYEVTKISTRETQFSHGFQVPENYFFTNVKKNGLLGTKTIGHKVLSVDDWIGNDSNNCIEIVSLNEKLSADPKELWSNCFRLEVVKAYDKIVKIEQARVSGEMKPVQAGDARWDTLISGIQSLCNAYGIEPDKHLLNKKYGDGHIALYIDQDSIHNNDNFKDDRNVYRIPQPLVSLMNQVEEDKRMKYMSSMNNAVEAFHFSFEHLLDIAASKFKEELKNEMEPIFKESRENNPVNNPKI